VIKNVRPETAHDEKMLVLNAAAYSAQMKAVQAHKNVEWYEKASEYYREHHLPKAQADRDEAIAAWHATVEALDAHETAYTGWKRYFLVVSSAGLIHASQNCHTCNKGRSATQFALLPSMSGLSDMSSLVETCGAALCSVCFPEAPVSWVDAVRLPTSVTLVLFEQGEAAFQAALAAYRAKAAAKAKVQCLGSGEAPVAGSRTPLRYGQASYATCPSCNGRHPVTNNGRLRKHSAK
jgi:hypothetical protein